MRITNIEQLKNSKLVHINDGKNRFFALITSKFEVRYGLEEERYYFTPLYFFTESKDFKIKELNLTHKVQIVKEKILNRYAEMFL